RYRTPYERLNELATDGTLGRPLQYFSVRVGSGPPGEDSWREDPAQACGMTIESLSHDIDLLRWWGGEIVAASGEALGSRADLETFDDNMGATFRYADGAIGVLQASWSADLSYGRRGIIGTEGTAILDGDDMFRTDRLRWNRADGTDAGEETYDEQTATDLRYDAEGRAFLDAVIAGEEPPITVHDGLRALEIADDILASSSMGLHEWMDADR
ncbi:MAG: Gfo/Idh/MocA family oxidoreductase, partial [Halobacteriales archaeon]|nr:Gfo/Idh/MocA family oxidoreductase [Halobacteriales archaeon]